MHRANSFLVSLGKIVATPGAMATLSRTDISNALRRHMIGDWGDVCPEDQDANDLAVTEGSRLLSAYRTESGVRFWVITEADRSATTLLLPEEY
jgi:hypothetical protein